ncbi:hypothetical protein J4573_01235 [Actinomadura barringtoniae]|uniref:Nucleotide exchange factor GrpE n=1 Tax=Actinomadura barringtoniae TaxID=1427535 RepID=A0A939T2T5_9ACTN|nr:hypothetical protein [Actinomadura barringtoniae]MBO2445704.1 hypothetical protein [Actinomadura barringtoniae]
MPETPYGWDAFSERDAPDEIELRSPAMELAQVLQLQQSALNAERGRSRTAVDEALAVAFDQAELVAKLGFSLADRKVALEEAGLAKVHDELRIWKDAMLDALRRGGVTVEDPTGRPHAEVADRIEVSDWDHDARFTAEVVARTEGPIVLHNGAVVRPGRVIMGAPAPADQDADQNREEREKA